MLAAIKEEFPASPQEGRPHGLSMHLSQLDEGFHRPAGLYADPAAPAEKGRRVRGLGPQRPENNPPGTIVCSGSFP